MKLYWDASKIKIVLESKDDIKEARKQIKYYKKCSNKDMCVELARAIKRFKNQEAK